MTGNSDHTGSLDYFEELTERLRAAGVPADRVAATIDDLAAHLDETGTEPEAEFGPAADFAAELTARTAGEDEAPPRASEWRWTADIFQDRQMLDHFGRQGWEVQRVDGLGRFVCRRDAERPLQWEYRRERVPIAGRRALSDRLAPDGWEPCGAWMYYEYFKRPASASAGPAAEVASPPEAPGRRTFFGRRFYVFTTVYLLVLALVGVLGISLGARDGASGFLVGVAFGVLLVVAFILVRARTSR
ncbi:hypothetical protein [Microtetraspora niveoalba]|uniref:hypothetical protein n=1 Tax=Microtetraspora niveoalba TaxID=46175 RepID=UPI000832D1CC|nr:hypothetical protein [Microtetraspora niveoalba]